MIKKIIVPVDFSSNSRTAFAYAMGLAADVRASLLIYHSWTVPYIEKEFSAPDRQRGIIKDQEKKLKLLMNMKKTAEENKLKCSVVMNEFPLIEGIIELVEGGSIIIMGSRGETNLPTIFMGSRTARMIMNSTVPVISVPPKVKYKGLNSIMLGVDYEKEFHWNFRKVKEVAAKKAMIKVVHIAIGEYSTPYENEMMKDIADTIRSDFKGQPSEFIEVFDEDIIDGLNKAVKKQKPDMLVLLTSKKSFFERMFWGSLAKRMALTTKVPLFTIPVKVSH